MVGLFTIKYKGSHSQVIMSTFRASSWGRSHGQGVRLSRWYTGNKNQRDTQTKTMSERCRQKQSSESEEWCSGVHPTSDPQGFHGSLTVHWRTKIILYKVAIFEISSNTISTFIIIRTVSSNLSAEYNTGKRSFFSHELTVDRKHTHSLSPNHTHTHSLCTHCSAVSLISTGFLSPRSVSWTHAVY